jgi:small-conductance mechanosensitive channel
VDICRLTWAFIGVGAGLQFLSRPFVVGDRVQMTGIGGVKASGVVEVVEPMRTLLRTDDGAAVRVPNKVG